MDREKISKLFDAMFVYFEGNPKRCQHLLKVYGFARRIAEVEGLDAHTRFLIETVALLHDCGAKPGEAKYGVGNAKGHIQEVEGIAPTRELLRALAYEPSDIERIVFLVSHHHTFEAIDGIDFQVLVEADMLVNMYTHDTPPVEIAREVALHFKTKTGTWIAKMMFGTERSAASPSLCP